MNYVSKRKKYGNKGSEYSSYKVGIKTLNFSIVYRLNGREETLLKGCKSRTEFGKIMRRWFWVC